VQAPGQAKEVKLRGKWVQIDPREWKNKFNMTVTVGLGTGSQQTILNGANMVLSHQKEAVALGLTQVVTPQNAYNALRLAAKAVFPKDADRLYTDPSTVPAPQPKPDHEMMKLQLQAHKQDSHDQLAQMKLQFTNAMADKERQFQAQLEQFKAQLDAAKQQRDHSNEIEKTAIEAAATQRSSLVQTLGDLKLADKQALNEHSQIVLQGAVDKLIEHVKTQNAAMLESQKQAHEASMMEKEIVRDEKGKATGVRPKRTVQ
jgi:hypothetical protein